MSGSVEGFNLCMVVGVEVTMITVFMEMVGDMLLEEVMEMEEDMDMEVMVMEEDMEMEEVMVMATEGRKMSNRRIVQ